MVCFEADKECEENREGKYLTLEKQQMKRNKTRNLKYVCAQWLSCVQLLAIPWISTPGSAVHGDSPGKNTRVGCHASSRVLISIIVDQWLLIQSSSCSVAKLCPTLCDPRDCSTPGSPVLSYLPFVV